jgi:hypothetical protein
MQNLYPVIRRKRRPLVTLDPVAPVKVEARTQPVEADGESVMMPKPVTPASVAEEIVAK